MLRRLGGATEPFVGLDGIEPSASPSRTGCAATALQSEVLRLPPENRVYTSPFPRNRVPLSRVCNADSAMAGRGTPCLRRNSRIRTDGLALPKRARCLLRHVPFPAERMVRHPSAGAWFRSCKATTLPSAEGRIHANSPPRPIADFPNPMGHSDASGALRSFLWTWRGSNPLPSRCERDALPVELQALSLPADSFAAGRLRAVESPAKGCGRVWRARPLYRSLRRTPSWEGGNRTRVWLTAVFPIQLPPRRPVPSSTHCSGFRTVRFDVSTPSANGA